VSKQSQTGLDCGALCSRPTAAHGLAHQAIVDLDVCPHFNSLPYV
jgi:hypothetical protein